jgi:4-amino-4-deoxy-L-arabinose transferase-like glycosyltransferase
MKKFAPSLNWTFLIDALLLIFLMGYVVAGVKKVPFHGDESTIIWMSKDYETVVLKGGIAEIAYDPPPRRTTEQHLRILNGTLSRWSMGAAWHSAGFEVDDINDQWVWGLDMEWNRTNGHMPSTRLLEISRLTSAWMTALSIIIILIITRLAARQIFSHPLPIAIAGWLAASFYALNPAVLLNGRRAMFEGGLLLCTALVAWAVLRITEGRSKDYLLAGIAAGLALSAKHSAVFTIGLLFFALIVAEIVKSRKNIRHLKFFAAKMVLAGLSASLIFLMLTPLWWSEHFLQLPGIVLDERQKLLDEQVSLFGKYENWDARLEGFWSETFEIDPQYYEVEYWADYPGVQQEIEDYEKSGLLGVNNMALTALRFILTALGCLWLIVILWRGKGEQRGIAFILLAWGIGLAAITLITVPLDWQRYYLPMQTPLSVLIAIGGAAIIQIILRKQVTSENSDFQD